MSLIVRVRAKTANEFRLISVEDDGSKVICNCDGFKDGICSHIDAVLIANERGMVPLEDWPIADAAYKITAGKITVPLTWKGTWRREFRWRGVSRVRAGHNPRNSGNMLVCFTGAYPGKSRRELIAEANANGWDTTNQPSPFTDVLVCADPTGNSAKLKEARKNNTAILSCEEWPDLLAHGVFPN